MTEGAQRAVDPEERLLVDITRLVLRADDPERQPKHPAIVAADQLLEGGTFSPLRAADERSIVGWCHDPPDETLSPVKPTPPFISLDGRVGGT